MTLKADTMRVKKLYLGRLIGPGRVTERGSECMIPLPPTPSLATPRMLVCECLAISLRALTSSEREDVVYSYCSCVEKVFAAQKDNQARTIKEVIHSCRREHKPLFWSEENVPQ